MIAQKTASICSKWMLSKEERITLHKLAYKREGSFNSLWEYSLYSSRNLDKMNHITENKAAINDTILLKKRQIYKKMLLLIIDIVHWHFLFPSSRWIMRSHHCTVFFVSHNFRSCATLACKIATAVAFAILQKLCKSIITEKFHPESNELHN